MIRLSLLQMIMCTLNFACADLIDWLVVLMMTIYHDAVTRLMPSYQNATYEDLLKINKGSIKKLSPKSLLRIASSRK